MSILSSFVEKQERSTNIRLLLAKLNTLLMASSMLLFEVPFLYFLHTSIILQALCELHGRGQFGFMFFHTFMLL